jgi:toxin ParE1/3/4
MRELRLSVRAQEDLEQLFVDGLMRFGTDQASAFQRTISATLERLRLFPELGPVRDDLARNPRCLTVTPYLVFYEVTDHAIIIRRILHGRMDVSSLDP